MRARRTLPTLLSSMLSMLGDSNGKILSTPTPFDFLRIVKVLVYGVAPQNLDDNSAEALKSELIAFLNLIGHGDCVTSLELWISSSLVL